MNYTIEELSVDNALDYAKVNALAWKQSYREIVDDDFLEFINTDEQIKVLTEKLKKRVGDKDNNSFLLRVDNKPVGIFGFRKSIVDGYSDCGELASIYLLDEVKGKGFGRILFQRNIDELKKLGYTKMINGCLEGNPSNEFYKHMGGRLVDIVDFMIPNGQVLKENIYYYDSI